MKLPHLPPIDSSNDRLHRQQIAQAVTQLAKGPIIDLKSSVDGANASILEEANTRADADSAEAALRIAADATLQTDVSNVSASVNTEITARVAGDTAEASARTSADATLQTNINTVSANVSTEITARVNGDSAEATARTSADATIQTNLDTTNANVTNEITARVNGDGALASDITTLNASFTAAVIKGEALNSDPHTNDISQWDADPSVYSIDDLGTGGIVGTKALKAAGNFNQHTAFNDIPKIPVDPNRTYRMHAWWQANPANPAAGNAFIGVILWDGDGNQIITGADNSFFWFSPVNNAAPSSTWQVTTTFFGASTSKTFPAGTAFMAPGVVLNYGSSFGEMWVQDIRIDNATDYTALTASITSEQTVRANADSAETTARTSADSTLQGNINTVSANLSSEETTRASADSAETSARTSADSTLQTNINTVSANLTTEQTTRATADSAETSARTSADSTLQTGLNSISASGAIQMTTSATASGADASFSIQVAASAGGSHSDAGFFMDALSAGGSRIRLVADQIELDGIVFNQGAIGTAHLASDAATTHEHNTATGAISQGASINTWTDLVSQSITTSGAPIEIQAIALIDNTDTGSPGTHHVSVRIYRDDVGAVWPATTEAVITVQGGQLQIFPAIWVETPSSGTYTYRYQWKTDAAALDAYNAVITLDELKR